jgi:asparagine synthase (glutamine-hydrolysing)
MRDTMIRRGPDDAGIYVKGNIALGHRRLSIIDVKTSHQPLANEDSTVWIVYNGEIYNFKELRNFLIDRGHTFKTRGDTEVILHLYEELGEDCVKELRGMFAFAIWDENVRQLFLARDRIGIKPLHYYWDGKQFVFGSEIKSIIISKDVKKEIDISSLHFFLSFLYVPAPQTMFSNIKKLLPGHTMIVKNGQIHIKKYWEISFSGNNRRKDAYYIEGLREVLAEAVKMRLVADVPLGAFLSGGIDSSSVVALMASSSPDPVKTFSIGFTEQGYNEANDARKVARHLRTDHYEEILDFKKVIELIPDLMGQFDEPFADSSAFPTHLVSQITSKKVKVALSGDGGDELFGGYYWWQKRPRYQLILNKLPLHTKHLLHKLGKVIPDGIKGKYYLSNINQPYHRFLLNSKAIFNEFEREDLYTSQFKAEMKDTDVFYYNQKVLDEARSGEWMDKMQSYDLMTYLPNDILVKVDIMSMYNSLEVRVPLLDHKVVEFAATIPSDLRIRKKVSKYVLKEVMMKYLPLEILEKKKHGFRIPLPEWINNELKDHVFDILLDKKTEQRGYFSKNYIRRLLDNYKVDMKYSYKIWELFAVELWIRKHLSY